MVERYTKFDHDTTEIDVPSYHFVWGTIHDVFVTDDPERDARCIEKLLDFEQYLVLEKYNYGNLKWVCNFFGLTDWTCICLYASLTGTREMIDRWNDDDVGLLNRMFDSLVRMIRIGQIWNLSRGKEYPANGFLATTPNLFVDVRVDPAAHYTLFVNTDVGSVSTPGDTFIDDIVRFPQFVDRIRWVEREEETYLTRSQERYLVPLTIVSGQRHTEKIDF